MANTTLTLPIEFAPGKKPAGETTAHPDKNERLSTRKERRSHAREPYKAMVPMAPWNPGESRRITDLRFTTVRCLDLSDGGLAIILPRLPAFTEACFCLARDNQPVYLIGRVANVVEGFYERRHQFRVGIQFVGQVRSDGTIVPSEGA